uniref:Uncharacterized protein n=1 Tax=Oryza barthii TaxID=65489 RepID=A0A0D3FLC3_9ORYZ
MAVANQEAMPPRTGNIATANPGCPNWEGAKEVEDTPNKWAPSEEGREKCLLKSYRFVMITTNQLPLYHTTIAFLSEMNIRINLDGQCKINITKIDQDASAEK